jgi:nucleotide-binding universal stress UspA family protein
MVNPEVQTLGASKDDVGDEARIVVGFDGSAESQSALEWAARQAELTGLSLEIVAAWEWPSSLGWAPMPGYDPVAETKKLLEPILVSLRASRPKISVGWKVVQGHPALVLVTESRGAELLVVGSRGHGEFVGMLIGSTSEYCVANAACPVVVFRRRG